MTGAVSADRLLRALDDDWRALGKDQSGAVLRACALTVIAVGGPDDDAAATAATLAGLMREYPSRSVVVRAGAGLPLEARGSIQCWLPHGGRTQVCSELLELSAGLEGLRQLAPVILGLIVPDLPVYLWCREARLALAPELEPIRTAATKVIVDTASLPPAEGARLLAELWCGPGRVADLDWGRWTARRQALARSGALAPPVRVESAWLAAWLASAMGWVGPLESCFEIKAGGTAPVVSDEELLRAEFGVFGVDKVFERALERYGEAAAL